MGEPIGAISLATPLYTWLHLCFRLGCIFAISLSKKGKYSLQSFGYLFRYVPSPKSKVAVLLPFDCFLFLFDQLFCWLSKSSTRGLGFLHCTYQRASLHHMIYRKSNNVSLFALDLWCSCRFIELEMNGVPNRRVRSFSFGPRVVFSIRSILRPRFFYRGMS